MSETEKKVAYLGPPGTFTEEALRGMCQAYPNLAQATFIPLPTIADCLLACGRKETDYAMVPMENSIEGSVNMTMDWLIHHVELLIQGEIALLISHHALVHPVRKDSPLSEVETVLSHPQAIAQCHQFIRRHCPGAKIKYTKSTAEAAEYVAGHPEEPLLAIGPGTAGQRYGLYDKAAHIEDYPNNYTRFVLVGHEPLSDKPVLTNGQQLEYKTTIQVTLKEDFPGALHQVLSAFAWRRLNLTRIESRPTKKKLGSYFFIIDIGLGMDEALIPGAIAEIEALGCHVRLLGSYPCIIPAYAAMPSKTS
ncbi:prephenate dehydratase [Caldalkalibacillus thermarum TA2.A1]|uniref:Prephenate dehydratase n=1 Tax=Caldalkalibacillus thermarum (strain TA2.A1) TaxID=986075 RepID=F5L424_CALTT|nr:prephenate dehydratase [Caldalkalibacillus thermarum]EGL83905.1 prephenate dehydratase [Caldalkalibacillus thermarum TA2.A1]